MDVKSLLEKLLFEEDSEEVIEEPIKDVRPIETIKKEENPKPAVFVENIKEKEAEPAVITQINKTPRKAMVDVSEVTYRPNYRTSVSIEKAQYVRQEPISPIFGFVSDKDKGEERKLTTPQFPSNIEGSRKIESVLSPIFGKDLPNEELIEENEVVEVIEEPVANKTPKTEVKKATETETENSRRYVPRHAEIKPEDNDVFYTNGLELDKIISLLNESEVSHSDIQNENNDFLDSIIEKNDDDSETISIFDIE